MIRILLLTAMTLASGPAWADDDSEPLSHDAARGAVARGEIRPLSDIVRLAREDFAAPLIEVEIERLKGRYVYELVLLGADGALVELYYDAATGDLLAIEREGEGREMPSLFSGDAAAPWNRDGGDGRDGSGSGFAQDDDDRDSDDHDDTDEDRGRDSDDRGDDDDHGDDDHGDGDHGDGDDAGDD